MKIVQIVGARPQFIKYVPVFRAIEEFNCHSSEHIKNILVHTGQHYDYAMSQVFFKELGINEPHCQLGIGSGPHGMQTGRMLERAEAVLLEERPDILIVYGDTNSTLCGALAASKMHIPIVHIEAGLRSYNKFMPEEINRVLTDHSSSLLFCPTETAVDNLVSEGFKHVANGGKLIDDSFAISCKGINPNYPMVVNSGDVMYDVLLLANDIAENKSKILEDLDITEKGYSVLTIHRAENTDCLAKLGDIMDFVNASSAGKPVIFPVHPRTMSGLKEMKRDLPENLKAIGPLGYFDIIKLLKHSMLVFTDSGGIQKEAYWLKVPCITLREETEWVETVQSGWNVLYKNYKGSHDTRLENSFLYGDGKTAVRIIDIITKVLLDGVR